ncbi:hypothetical protein [Stieleria varia]|uniref:Uncharacterized protein n=1 Tax=Stieleria varia TaxID=2528005 RepID=A0A5C6AQD1_9BACT|nr:hypothetical protein [Stieleria varia]TWU02253.1 hypothetical protein Pla52n_33030 [Stieleria varia]
MPDAVHTGEILHDVLGLTVIALLVWGFGRLVHFLQARKSRVHRLLGHFVPEWSAAVSLLFGLICLTWNAVYGDLASATPQYPDGFAPPTQQFEHGIFAMFGMLVGLVFGLIHGVILLTRTPKSELTGHADPKMASPIEDGNPYRPPSV